MKPASGQEMTTREIFDTSGSAEESFHSRFAHKFKESPLVVVGLAGWVGIVAYGIHSFKKRSIRPSLFIIQLRLAAQSAVVGMLMLGCSYQLYNRLKKTEDTQREQNTRSEFSPKN